MTLQVQTVTMLAMIIGGIYIGFAQDTYRRFARLWQKSRLLVYLLEILFWLSQTVLLFYVLFRINDGEVRFYIFLACLLGFSIYVVLLQQIYLRVLDWLTRIVKRTLLFFIRLFTAPLLLIWRSVYYVLKWFLRVLITICKWGGKIIYGVAQKIFPQKFFNFITKIGLFCSTMIHKISILLQKLVGK